MSAPLRADAHPSRLLDDSAAASRSIGWRGRWRAFVGRQRSRWLTEHWRIGLIDAPLTSLLVQPSVSSLLRLQPVPTIRWLTLREPGGYWADPFPRSGHPAEVWAERFDEASGVGHIERLELQGDALVSLGPVATADGVAVGRGLHASFPNAFELDGLPYVVCETGAARDCVVYRVADDGRWHSPIVVLRDVAAADPAIFRWQGRLWLAITDADRGPHDNLCLFHADRLDGPWQPHRDNPVREDKAGARMAGAFFEHDGALYRPGQDCRAGYGAAVVIHRVDDCSPDAYRETEVRRLLPDADGEAPDGLHTLNAWGERTLVDGKTWHFSSVALKRKLLARLGR